MEFASRLRWFIVIGFVLLALILVGWGMFSIASNIFRDDTSGSSNSSGASDSAYDIASTAVARFTKDGPVVANEEHRSYTIEVSQGVVSMKVYKAYGQVVVAEKSYANTPEAFDAFIQSLENEEVTDRIKGTDSEDDFDEAGACATGYRLIVELDNDVRRWSTSCRNTKGTAATRLSVVDNLFEKQIVGDDFRELVRGTGL